MVIQWPDSSDAGYEFVIENNPPKRTIHDVFTGLPNVDRYKLTLGYKAGSITYSDINEVPEEDFINHIVEGRAIAGYDIKVNERNRITPFFGVGYRYQLDPSGSILDIPLENGIISRDDNSEYSLVDPNFSLRQDYEVHTHYLYIPLGFMTNTDISDSFSVGFNLEMDVILWGMIKNDFSDIGPIYIEDVVPDSQGNLPPQRTQKLANTTNQLRGGFGFKGSTKFIKKQKKFDWYVEPYYRFWLVNQSDGEQLPQKRSDGVDLILFKRNSDIPYEWVEPESTSSEYGLQVGIIY